MKRDWIYSIFMCIIFLLLGTTIYVHLCMEDVNEKNKKKIEYQEGG